MKFDFGAYCPKEHWLNTFTSSHQVAAFMLGRRYKQWIVWLRVEAGNDEELYPININACDGNVNEIQRLCEEKIASVWLEKV